jgi:hypothetical protein
MSPFEALYDKKCNMLVRWDILTNKFVIGLELLREMEEKMIKINHNLNITRYKQKRYAKNGRTHKEFGVGEHEFMKVNEKRSLLKLGSCPKLATRYCDPFEVLERIGPAAYMLAFPTSMRFHNVFCVSLLKQYVFDPNHVFDWVVI